MSPGTPQRETLGVLHLVPNLGREGTIGGAARVVVDLVRGTRLEDGFRTHLCSLGCEDPAWADYGLADHPFHLGHSGRYRSAFEFMRSSLHLRRLIAGVKPAILHTHLWQADQIGAAARPPDVIHIVHIHDTRPWVSAKGMRNAARRALYGFFVNRSRAIFIACAEAVKSYACTHLRIAPEKVHVVLNAIDRQWLASEPVNATAPHQPVVGCAALLQPGKGYETLLQAVDHLRRSGCECRLRIAGGGSRLAHYESLAAQLGIGRCTEFAGRIQDMKAFYDSLDVFVLPSFSEGLPLSILEAMGRGKPVVATNVAGVPEAVRNGEDGLLVPPGDPAALADALRKLLTNPPLRAQMGAAGRQRVQAHFLTDRAAQQVTEIYRRATHIGAN